MKLRMKLRTFVCGVWVCCFAHTKSLTTPLQCNKINTRFKMAFSTGFVYNDLDILMFKYALCIVLK